MTTAATASGEPALACRGCQIELPSLALACPRCQRLVHSERLAELAKSAQAFTSQGEVTQASAAWEEALLLLPSDSKQHQQIRAKLATLSSTTPAAGAGFTRSALGGIGVLSALLWKFKLVVLFIVTKAKLLLLGFTKASTLLSALAAFGVYWSVWGWRFALGFVLCTYVHEMGHVAALKKYGIPASAPMFIPGLGAFVRLSQNPASVQEDARIGLAGPVWGLVAALVCAAVGALAESQLWLALAKTTALLNLFNLIPLGSLDGGRATRALSRQQRWLLCLVLGLATLFAGEPLLTLLLLAGVVSALSPRAPTASDRGALALYVLLVSALTLLCRIPVRP